MASTEQRNDGGGGGGGGAMMSAGRGNVLGCRLTGKLNKERKFHQRSTRSIRNTSQTCEFLGEGHARLNTMENKDYERSGNEIKVYHERPAMAGGESNDPDSGWSRNSLTRSRTSLSSRQQQPAPTKRFGIAETAAADAAAGAAMRQRQREYDQRTEGEAKSSPAADQAAFSSTTKEASKSSAPRLCASLHALFRLPFQDL
uniref:Uncharacterized protein n=1 Tax=Macrostomum lignano TaxID=282301 RepID=A0A1I8FMN1_9PLAT